MEKIRWGILSTANIGQTQFIPAIFRADNAEVVAVASRSAKVHEAAKRLSIPAAYESYEELLDDPNVDAVYIPLPNHLHKEWVEKAAEKGKHILCEKPAALNANDAAAMVRTCKEHQVKFMEGYMYQLHPQHDRVKEIIASGEIGKVKLIKSSHSFHLENQENIRLDKSKGGGSLYDVGCYAVQLIRHITDEEPVEVTASAEMAAGVDLSTVGFLKMESGITALFDCSFDMVARNEYEIIGNQGTISVPYAFRPDRNGGVGEIIITTGNTERIEKTFGDIYKMEVEHFSDAILKDYEPRITGDSTIKNMKVIEACYRSIETGRSVQVND
ncbi:MULTISPECIES: Gfo/Idh/MocA family protein [unclassified Sporosarcina]|uniref:Gfo/Idh/MocA family protein n=1 Tax=unclassified Sporosarcina TaxID=2647733 RepID=UPI0020408A65|nr:MULTISPECIES: Gfo/Idh/MocA family oxidoreductase [unclassified Sporosarcina]GKV65949.1 oxidoreductase [Sporosarcina sp. NCCP-2331]GLB56051.1 oxidoreductase [Sporosarcina sp. NCCP-2378]